MRIKINDGMVRGLLVSFKNGSEGYLHFQGKVLSVLKRRDEYGDDCENPDKTIIRNPSSDTAWADLSLRSQGKDTDCPRNFYGEAVAYQDVYSVDARRVEKMATLLGSITRKLHKLYDAEGPYSGLAGFVSRACRVMGLKYIIFKKSDRGWSYDDNEYRYLAIGDGVAEIAAIESRWKDTGFLTISEKVA